jgi:hypothetical protein
MLNDENEYQGGSNWAWWLLLIIVLYIVVSSELKNYNLRQNEQKVLNDENYNLATRLRQAFNISFISDWITTYNETELFNIAGLVKDYQKVSDAYRDLYSESLYERLQKTFHDEPEKVTLFLAKTKSVGSGVGGGGTVIPKAGALIQGKIASCLVAVNALNPNNSAEVFKTFPAFQEVGVYLGDKVLAWVSKGVRYQVTFAVCQGKLNWYSVSESRYLIEKSKLITY